jgi:CheY-like chemotaxis protein
MDYNNFISYFDRFIKPYLPFKNNKTYQSFCSLLKDNYFKDSYLNIPEHLATYVEDQKVNIELYSKLLIGNGYPEDLVNQLSTAEKEILIDKFMHYQAKSGTLAHFKQICNEFGDNFNVYELYADYRKCTVNAKITMDWIMAPKPIYKYNNATPTTYDYDEIYNGTPTYFLSKLQLELWRKGKSITLPFKTNLIMLDLQSQKEENEMEQLLAATTFFYFKDYYFSLFLEGETYDITISDAYRLYYYIIYRYTNHVN